MHRLMFCLLFALSAWSFPSAEGRTYCPNHKCDGDRCLPLQWVCDGENDCQDGSDEENCQPEPCQEGFDFQCADSVQCIPMKWKCDGDKDCHNGADEVDCANMTCAEDHVSCGPGNGCIHSSFVCDGHVDCPGGLDEKISTCKNMTCSVDEFQCRSDHRCISSRWRCDGDFDCDDRSDEESCPAPSCDADHFQCRINTTQCISNEWRCDGAFDCHDRTDEENCNKNESSNQCDENEFLCLMSHACIHQSWVCDGDFDCGDSSDEHNCPVQTCKSDEYQCRKTGDCVPAHWKCDGKAQCDDRSDEEDCPRREPCNPHTEFECSRGIEPNCIPVGRVCDGRNDCGRYEDEAPELCRANHTDPCAVGNGGCMHNCTSNVLGHYCTCHKGYQLNADNETCDDIDECKILGSCSQLCNNTKGSFKCSCHAGYDLSPISHHLCLAQEEPFLLFANRHEIVSVGLRHHHSRPLVSDLHSARTLDYDFVDGWLFWWDAANHTISRLKLDSTNAEAEVLVSTGLRSVERVAFDWIHKNLYWTDSDNNQIEVLSVQPGSTHHWRKTLIADLDKPKDVVLDPRSDKYVMYWTECGKQPKIRSASLNGSLVRDVVLPGSDVVWPNALALDYEMNVLYWVDMKLHLIASIDVGSGGPTNRRVVLTSFTFLRHPYSLTVFEDYLYWSDSQTQSVLKVNQFSSSSANVTRVATRLNSPLGVQIYHRLRQPRGESVCKNQCSHICLPTYAYKKFSCACPNSDSTTTYKMGQELTTCLVINSTVLPTEGNNASLPSRQSSGAAETPTGVIAVVVVVLISAAMAVIVVISCFVMKRHKRRNIKSMNFDNPVYRKRSEDQFSLEKNEYQQAIDLPGRSEVSEPLRLHVSCDNYVMSEN